MSEYKYQISVGWSKFKGWHLLGNVPANTLKELDSGTDAVIERIGNIKDRLEQKNADDDLEHAFHKVAEGKEDKSCPECMNNMIYKEGVSAKTNKPWRGYFCENQECKKVEWIR